MESLTCFTKIRNAFVVGAAVSIMGLVAQAQNPVPQIVGPVKPTAVVPGSGAFTLMVYGANFVSGSVVNWNGQPRSTSFVSAHEVQAQILASDITSPTAGFITVSNPQGQKSSTFAQLEVHVPVSNIVTSNTTNYDFGWFALDAADFNGDGKLDLIGPGPVGINCRLGNGDGTFRFGSIAGRNYHYPFNTVYGDFNGDGNLDIAYVSGDSGTGYGKNLLVMLGDGTGKFTLASTLTSWAGYSWLAVGDFNGDGKLDIAVAQGQNLGILLGNGDGTFTPFKTYPFPGPSKEYVAGDGVLTADFNGDGVLDLLTIDQYGDINVLLGKGDGTFKTPSLPVASYGIDGYPFIAVSDFNGDGKTDIAFATKNQK